MLLDGTACVGVSSLNQTTVCRHLHGDDLVTQLFQVTDPFCGDNIEFARTAMALFDSCFLPWWTFTPPTEER